MPITVDDILKELCLHSGKARVKRYDDGVWRDLDIDCIGKYDENEDPITEDTYEVGPDNGFIGIR